MSKKSDLRKSRYNYFRELGYSSKEASRLRDRDPAKSIPEERRKITKKPASKRTQQEKTILERTENKQIQVDLGSSASRFDQFRRWSGWRRSGSKFVKGRSSFPKRYLDHIREINDEAGFDFNSSFGYRVFYHEYVEGMDYYEAEQFVRENKDS